MKSVIISFILGVVITLSVTGIPNVVALWNSIQYREIISQTADKWFIEGYNTGYRNSLNGQMEMPNIIDEDNPY